LTDVWGLDKNRLWVTCFKDEYGEIPTDEEAAENWAKQPGMDSTHILFFGRKDNFWEMAETGPCGPCSEIHIDLGPEFCDKRDVPGHVCRVNGDCKRFLELWNLVFIQYNRLSPTRLEPLPARHVDTGMGFERLCMVLQGKQSTYDTDVFTPIIQHIENLTKYRYDFSKEYDEQQRKINIAIRVIADHIRAISFAIADGQLPSNTGAGYVIRRILRRAIRYAFQYLHQQEPVIFQLVSTLVRQMGDAFPEIQQQQTLIESIIKEEEQSFLRTLDKGLKKLDDIIVELHRNNINIIPGDVAFELYDTYGFPYDLTQLIAKENDLSIDEKEFQRCLEEQKNRSRTATSVATDDWIILSDKESKFIGYDFLKAYTKVVRYRSVTTKNKQMYHLVLEQTPFYPEGGGQVGDTGILIFGDENTGEKIKVLDTKKETGTIIHITDQLPQNIQSEVTAIVHDEKRYSAARHHSATHLLQAALRKILGTHVEQKGSLVHPDYLRFDFSHFSKLTEEQIIEIERLVNQKILENIPVEIQYMPLEEAKKMGAMALFGEKYEDIVRVVIMDRDYSIELCGGTHVRRTGDIGLFKIVSEEAVSAGVRRIEAMAGMAAWQYVQQTSAQLKNIKEILKANKDIDKKVVKLLDENKDLKRQVQELLKQQAQMIKKELKEKIIHHNGKSVLIENVDIESTEEIKNILFELNNEVENFIGLLINENKDKVYISLIISPKLTSEKNLNAVQIIKEISKYINGGGGGQPHFAQAGGSNKEGIKKVVQEAERLLMS
jgi:alanyl-tRNA synthetase